MNATKQFAVDYQRQKIECQQLVVELMTSNNMPELAEAVASLEQYKEELAELLDNSATTQRTAMNAAKLITVIYYYSIIAALTTDYNKRVVLQLSTFERVFWDKVEKYIDNLI